MAVGHPAACRAVLLRLGRQPGSAVTPRLVDLPEPRVGDRFTSVGGRPQGRIVSLDPPRQLTATILGAYLSYVLVPEGPQATRLLLKVVMQSTRFGVALSVGDLVMARRQLLNLKRLAELESSRGVAGG